MDVRWDLSIRTESVLLCLIYETMGKAHDEQRLTDGSYSRQLCTLDAFGMSNSGVSCTPELMRT